MALLENDLECDECGKVFDGVRAVHRDPKESWKILCSDCLNVIEKDTKQQWLKKIRKGKTLEQRVESIEEFIYHVVHETNNGDMPDGI